MPRRFLGYRQPCLSMDRMTAALESDLERQNVDEIIESQDQKLQEIKRTVFSGVSLPIKLCAETPILMSTVTDIPTPSVMISTHYNNHEQSLITGAIGSTHQPVGGIEIPKPVREEEIDFSKAEDFFQLEAPIDARKDQNILKLAYTVPKRTFMSRILHKYPIHKKRLAFIQRRTSQLKSMEVVGNLIVSAKGGEAKEVSISCQVCGQRFSRQYQFQRHILMHPDPENKKFLCQICGKRFNRADHLNRHAILHGEVKIHKCLLCGEEFDRASHLDRHRRKHHPPAGQQPSQTPPLTPHLKSPPPPNLLMTSGYEGYDGNVSPVEQQSSGTNLHLLASVATPDGAPKPTEHAQMGSGNNLQVVLADQVNNLLPQDADQPQPEPERPFPCDVCGRRFIRATHLRRHMRIHTGEKPFACHICGRRYARGDYLRAHIHAHRRDKIHKCKHCGEVFHDLTRFADHCRLLHKDLDDEFGNPKPPPESSPPPPNLSAILETTLAAESGEQITVYSMSDNHMVQTHMVHPTTGSNQSVPITLVNLADPAEEEVIISTIQPPSHDHRSLPTPQATPMASPELQLAHLQALAAHHDPHILIQNGHHLSLPDPGNEITILSHSPHDKATPTSYIDPVTQYIFSNSNNSNNGVATIYPTPHPSPVIGHRSP